MFIKYTEFSGERCYVNKADKNPGSYFIHFPFPSFSKYLLRHKDLKYVVIKIIQH